jgi:phosphopantetheine--protein transferase-like protein
VIGNDIVDLKKAKTDSNIFRPRYMEKVLSQNEQNLVLSSPKPEQDFWRLWTMKESAYKAFQRKFNSKPVFNPFAFHCELMDSENGLVHFGGDYVKTTTTFYRENYTYCSVSCSASSSSFIANSKEQLIRNLRMEFGESSQPQLLKLKNNLPFIKIASKTIPVSITHHGIYFAIQF